jgi:hypothetical protein
MGHLLEVNRGIVSRVKGQAPQVPVKSLTHIKLSASEQTSGGSLK